MRRRSLVLIAIVAVAMTVAGTAQAAPPLTVPVAVCNDVNKTAGGWLTFGLNVGEDRCSVEEGLEISIGDTLVGDQGGWAMPASSGAPVLSYSFDIEGGDTSGGFVYVAATCSSCGVNDATVTSMSPGGPAQHVEVSAPESTEGLWIYAECVTGPICTGSATPARISNIVVNVTDEESPTVQGSVNFHTAGPGDFVGWTNKKVVPTTMTAYDTGSGIWKVETNFSGLAAPASVWDFSGDCAGEFPLAYFPPCPPFQTGDRSADISSLDDGIHDVTFSAQDPFGNTATTGPAQIGIDRVVPTPPLGAALDFIHSGWPGQRWTSDPDVTMSWNDIPELVDPELESPYESQDLSLHRDGTSTVTHETKDIGTKSADITLPADGEWDFAIRYVDHAGNIGDPSTKSVGLDADAPFAPKGLADVDWLSASALGQGKRIAWDPPDENPELESGVCGYVVAIDDSPSSNPIFGVDDTTIKTSWPLPAGLDDGMHYFHVRAVSCAGVASETATAAIRIDTQAPLIAVDGLAAAGVWANVTQTAIVSASDAVSDVAKVGFAFEHGAIVWTAGEQESVAIPEGAHHLTAYAVDVAGNTSAFEADVKTDTHSPVVDLENESSDDPTRVSATVADTDSGLFAAAVELRRVDAGADTDQRQWQPLGGAEPITRGTTKTVEISRVLDDSRLALGDYELRVNSVDLAGNSTTDGAFATRSAHLPLRGAAEISAAVAEITGVCRTKAGKSCASTRKCPRDSSCRTVRVIDRDHARQSRVQTWSQKAALVGDALDANGAPIAGVPVTISSTPLLHETEPIGTTTTDANGHYELILPSGPSRKFVARIAGSLTQQPASAEATLNVRSDLEFKPRPRKLRPGHALSMRGRVLHPEWLPVGGISVSFQWYSPNGWVNFANPTLTDAQGKFGLSWPKLTSGSTVKIRARVDQPAGWPFAPGSSDAVKITVLAAR